MNPIPGQAELDLILPHCVLNSHAIINGGPRSEAKLTVLEHGDPEVDAAIFKLFQMKLAKVAVEKEDRTDYSGGGFASTVCVRSTTKIELFDAQADYARNHTKGSRITALTDSFEPSTIADTVIPGFMDRLAAEAAEAERQRIVDLERQKTYVDTAIF